MGLQQFARSGVYYNQSLLETVQSVDLKTDAGWIPVKTLLKGLSGFTNAGGMVTIKVEVAIPIGGPEAPFQPDSIDGNIVILQVPIGAKDYLGNGQVTESDFSQSTDKELKGSFTWVGELKKIE